MQNKPPSEWVNIPSVSESYADGVEPTIFDGHSARITFSIQRFEGTPKPGQPPRSVRVPSARIVLAPQAAVELYNQLSRLIGLMEQQGVVKRDRPPEPATKQ